MFILYFALWVVLNGRWTLEIGAFGVAFAALAYLFTCRFMGYSLSVDFALLRRAPHAISYGIQLLKEIVKANLTVMKMILDRDFEPKPHLVQFDVNLKRERHRVALANSITLTPGTITVNLEDNHYIVHCLDTSLLDGLDDGVMVKMLERYEQMNMPAPAAKDELQEEVLQDAPAAQETESGSEPACGDAETAEETVSGAQEEAEEETKEEAKEETTEAAEEGEHEH